MSADYQSHRNALWCCLSAQEQQRALRKKIPTKQFEYILGQAALRCVLAQALSIPADKVRYRRGHKGKPALDPLHQAQDLCFNITHSGGLLLLALSAGGEVGVDIEAINTHTSMDLVSRRAFSQDEIQKLQGLPEHEKRQHFFQLWTCKEAVVKCTGDGIHSGMNLFTVQFPQPGQAKIAQAWGVQSKTRKFSVCPLDLGDRHRGTLVSANPLAGIRRYYLPERFIRNNATH